jgi:hypothetical protein
MMQPMAKLPTLSQIRHTLTTLTPEWIRNEPVFKYGDFFRGNYWPSVEIKTFKNPAA